MKPPQWLAAWWGGDSVPCFFYGYNYYFFILFVLFSCCNQTLICSMSLPSNFLFFGATVKLKCSWYHQRVECFRLCVRVCVCLRVSLAEGCAPFCTFIVLQACLQSPVSSKKHWLRPRPSFGMLLRPLPSCCWIHFFFLQCTIFFFFLSSSRRLSASLSPSEWLELTCHSVFVTAAPAGPRSPRPRRTHISACWRRNDEVAACLAQRAPPCLRRPLRPPGALGESEGRRRKHFFFLVFGPAVSQALTSPPRCDSPFFFWLYFSRVWKVVTGCMPEYLKNVSGRIFWRFCSWSLVQLENLWSRRKKRGKICEGKINNVPCDWLLVGVATLPS